MAIKFSKTNIKYKCFSNFFNSNVTFDGLTYKNNEAAWQAQKTLDIKQREAFTKLSPSDAKKAGRGKLALHDENGNNLGCIQLRADWEDIKYQLMVDVCLAKFNQNTELKEILLSTGDEEIIENTTGWHDNIWGNCECDKCIGKTGQNLLGKALMKVRETLREQN